MTPSTSIKGVPLKLAVNFAVPGGVRSLVRFNYYGKVLNVVASRPAAIPPPATVTAGNFNILLGGCTARGNGSYTCTSATVTPR